MDRNIPVRPNQNGPSVSLPTKISRILGEHPVMGPVRYKPPPWVGLFHPTAVLLIVFSLPLSWGSHSLHRQPAKTKSKIIIGNCFQGSNCETRKSSRRELIKKAFQKWHRRGKNCTSMFRFTKFCSFPFVFDCLLPLLLCVLFELLLSTSSISCSAQESQLELIPAKEVCL